MPLDPVEHLSTGPGFSIGLTGARNIELTIASHIEAK
jgi:hypothetical protein